MKFVKKNFEIDIESDSFSLTNLKGEIKALISYPDFKDKKFTVDIYGYMSRNHPDDHLGWWQFNMPSGKNEVIFRIDFSEKHVGSILMLINNTVYPASDAWVNQNYMFNPLQDFLFTIRSLNNNLIYELPIIMKINDYIILKEFYHKLHQEHKYTDKGPFLWIMHEHKLKILKKLFNKYFKQNFKVLDIGCGRSLFTEINQNWQFSIYAGDIEHALILSRKMEYFNVHWLVMNAVQLPFQNNSFDAIFAGEIIEHMPDPVSTLQEWKRILKPKGILILTTPNKDRLTNIVNKIKRPFSPDHYNEFSVKELKYKILPYAGFNIIKNTGAYLELILTKSSNGLREDYLQRKGNISKNKWLMHLLNILGQTAPTYCLDIILVAEKVE